MAARFFSKLQFQDDGGLPFVLLSDLIYVTEVKGIGPNPKDPVYTVRVPAGFKTDLASIPRALWTVLPPVGKYDAAAVVHDYLYQTGGIERGQADAVLLEAMRILGVGRFTRSVIYSGVRVGGWRPWGAYRKKDGK